MGGIRDTSRVIRNLETSIPSGPKYFHTTAWSIIRDAQTTEAEKRRQALDRLISVYWRPVYWTLRIDWKASREEAKDLTQEYFSRFVEKRMVDTLSRARGRFRSYVKVSLKHFMLSRRRARKAQKRGGGRKVLALEDLDRVEAQATARAEPPEKRFERELMRSIIQKSLEDLEEACTVDRRRDHFRMFQKYYFGQASGKPVRYEELAQEFDIGLHTVKNRLAELRARFREITLSYLRDGVSSEEQLFSEIKDVFEA